VIIQRFLIGVTISFHLSLGGLYRSSEISLLRSSEGPSHHRPVDVSFTWLERAAGGDHGGGVMDYRRGFGGKNLTCVSCSCRGNHRVYRSCTFAS